MEECRDTLIETVNLILTDGNLEEHPADRLQARKETLIRTLAYLKQQLPRFMVQANQKIDELNDFLGMHRGHPIFVNLNYGTTFKGAFDSVVEAMDTLVRFYDHDKRIIDVGGTPSVRFHVDGALGAAYMPYLKMAAEEGRKFEDGCAVAVAPEFDLSLDAVHSIAMSGHKWIGALVPCGIFMSKTRYQLNPPSNPNYIGTPDTSFAGSRNGLSAVYMWSDISKHKLKQQIDKAVQCQGKARFINDTMTELDKKLKLDLWVALSPTVRFRQLNDDLTASPTLSMVCNASIHRSMQWSMSLRRWC
ncbi:hypothetical protein SELMODRAFT_408374 [Selaginella moellendorffii]|uniref:Uncharacterized protein n=1 Tax=Selaginella moellendorffii TaxID=88036 RepID=D8R834_SELML|nr:hypothetical protein SELMODRAFT_408374 [Selaginella moellendorffii]